MHLSVWRLLVKPLWRLGFVTIEGFDLKKISTFISLTLYFKPPNLY